MKKNFVNWVSGSKLFTSDVALISRTAAHILITVIIDEIATATHTIHAATAASGAFVSEFVIAAEVAQARMKIASDMVNNRTIDPI